MKKLFLIIAFSTICAILHAQTVEMNYSFNTPTVNSIRGYEQVQFDGCMQSALMGQPSLPWKSVSLLLPEGQEAESIEVILSDFETLEGTHQLFPYQPSRTTNDLKQHELVIDESIYASKSTYPAENHGVVTTQYKNGYGFAFSAFTPVQYIPSSGKVMFAKKATVRVHLTPAKSSHSAMLWGSPAIKNSVRRLAQNPEMMASYQTQGREVTGYDLLIITSSEFVEAYNEYCDYYNSIGLHNRIATVSDIYNTTEGFDNQDKIRNYIIQEYQENGIMMVVLGGDVDIIPYRGLYCTVQSSSVYESNNLPADLYYCGLDGTWNDNGNNRFGEPGEDDLLPEIGMSRMSFQNTTDLANMIHKTLSYQQNPVLGEFRKVVFGGEHLYDSPESNGSDYLELLIGTRDDNGYTTTCYPVDYNFTKLYEEQGNWSGSLLRQAINEGTGYVHHDGHANSGYVAGWYGISNDDFWGANGTTHNYTFFHSQGCDCGAFDENCILEKMVKIQNFAVAVIGNSRYGWFNEGQTEGPGCHLEREMTDAQFNDRIGLLGCAISEGKTMTAPWVNAPGQWEEGALRWNFYDMNVLGDGAVNVWLDEPFNATVDYPNQVVLGTQSIEVTVTDDNGVGQKNFRCVLYMDDDVVAMGVTDDNGVAEIAFEGGLSAVGTLKMKVTGVNAWPQEVELLAVPSNTPYIVYDSYSLIGDTPQIEFDGNYAFNMVLKNIGSVNASNVTATMSCDSEHVTINQTTVNVGNVDGNQSVTLENAFAFTVSDNVPNNTNVRFNITCTDGTDSWESHFNARIFAPEFELVSTVLETTTGQALNPGDSGTVHFTFKNNGGTTAPTATFTLINLHEGIIVSEGSPWVLNNIAAGEEFLVDVVFMLGTNVQDGALYEFHYSEQFENYVLEDSYYLPVGQSIESFETGNFSAFNWQSTSPIYAWSVVRENPYEGQYCAKSSSINDYETSALFITVEVGTASEMSFYYKVSSEANYDKLHFKIDNVEKDNWSGEVGWTQASYPLTPGTHQLRWEYTKDVSLQSGYDCAWIDYIVLPASTIITEVKEEVSHNCAIYPNPNKGNFNIELGEETCTVTVFNSMGQTICQQENISGTIELHLDLNAGIYFVNVKSPNINKTEKVIVD
ncbi:MAG: T9SS type A sorting domain-containing protein [Bacteroidales bacterium]|nr:T9SS type A sorting domain-containing protein [Bacteroidales bacterium]